MWADSHVMWYLEFTLPEVVAVIVAVHLIFQINGDGETNWLEGVQLLSVYLILGILFFLPAGESARGLKPIDVRGTVKPATDRPTVQQGDAAATM